eukprot:5132173-Prymnesium_polylepis.1
MKLAGMDLRLMKLVGVAAYDARWLVGVAAYEARWVRPMRLAWWSPCDPGLDSRLPGSQARYAT